MKLCRVCAQSDMLCSACSRRVESGEISKVEIALTRAIRKLGKEGDYSVDFIAAIERAGRIYVIVDSKHAARFIGPGGRNVKKLSQIMGKPVKMLVKTTGTEKHVIEKLVGAPVIGINKVYDGVESLKVRLEKKYASVGPLEGIVSGIIEKKIKFVFE